MYLDTSNPEAVARSVREGRRVMGVVRELGLSPVSDRIGTEYTDLELSVQSTRLCVRTIREGQKQEKGRDKYSRKEI